MDAGHRTIVALLVGLALTLLLLAGLGWLVSRTVSDPDELRARIAAQRHRQSRKPLRARLYRRANNTPSKSLKVAQRQRREDEEKKKKKEKKPEDKLTGQIVETARPEKDERPKVAKYLGRWDMKVKVEQKSKGRKRKGRELGTRKIDNPSKLQSPTSKSLAPTALKRQQKKQQQKKQKRRDKKRERKVAKRASGQDAKIAAPRKSNAATQPKTGPGALAAGGDPRPRLKRPSVVRGKYSGVLLPSTSAGNVFHNVQALAGRPGSDDYLPDVDKQGDTNLLNTHKYRFHDFFMRVRERVRAEWDPAGAWRSRDPDGKRYGVRDRLTVLRVRLEPNGSLKDIRVQKLSGLRFLDDEARRAFVAGGPYPNPPRGLVNARGEVEFKFGFMFEISSSRFKFYRMRR